MKASILSDNQAEFHELSREHDAIEKTIRELTYKPANHWSPDDNEKLIDLTDKQAVIQEKRMGLLSKA